MQRAVDLAGDILVRRGEVAARLAAAPEAVRADLAEHFSPDWSTPASSPPPRALVPRDCRSTRRPCSAAWTPALSVRADQAMETVADLEDEYATTCNACPPGPLPDPVAEAWLAAGRASASASSPSPWAPPSRSPPSGSAPPWPSWGSGPSPDPPISACCAAPYGRTGCADLARKTTRSVFARIVLPLHPFGAAPATAAIGGSAKAGADSTANPVSFEEVSVKQESSVSELAAWAALVAGPSGSGTAR